MKINKSLVERPINNMIILINKNESSELYPFFEESKKFYLALKEIINNQKLFKKICKENNICEEEMNLFIKQMKDSNILVDNNG